MFPSGGVHERDRADEARGAVPDAFEVLQEERVVGGRAARLTRVARGADARRAAEGIHLKSRIVRKAPVAAMLRSNRPHLDEGVADEVGRILLDARRIVREDLIV